MNDLFAKLEEQEKKFFESEFFSPVLRGQEIRVRISNVDLNLKVHPQNFSGWGIFKSEDQKTARFVREPSMRQKSEYLKLYPVLHFVVCRQGSNIVRGIPSNKSDTRFSIQGQVPINFPEEVRLFDTIDVRFDGVNMWYDKPSAFRNTRVASLLRDSLSEEVQPEDVSVDGVSAEERIAYAIAYDFEIESKRDRKEERLKASLQRGGAVLRSYVERGDTYTVEFSVGSERHRSVVNSETLRVQSAGICLEGGDSDFDLQSLVGVIREGQNRHLIYRVGINR